MKNTEYGKPVYRPLKVYAFDPTLGRGLGNYMTINVPYEDNLKPGPVGHYLAVIDYDTSNDCYYRPVNLDDPNILIEGGLNPSESNPQFHQQMVYAVASETIQKFEHALGRPIKWGFNRFNRGGGKDKTYPDQLRIFPHSMQMANAYYSRDLRALVFGYFPASETDPGLNLPNQTVFTCLSHDIIAHETTHALIDSQRIYFTEPTGPDAAAFHEAFADIVALFQHFSFKDALQETIQRTGGQIYRTVFGPESQPDEKGPTIQTDLTSENPMVGLAKQFGEAMGMRRALRSALGTPPNSQELSRLFEPHFRGSILVAAVFDAFFSIYVRRTSDLIRIARAGGMQTSSDYLHPDLAARLAKEAAKTAEHFLNICIRAIDYCPVIDILFGDFLRAMITADYELVDDDHYGYRAALIDAFRSRGIVPTGVTSYSEESLLWDRPEASDGQDLPFCKGLDFELFRTVDSEEKKAQDKHNAIVIHQFAENYRELLHLSKDPKLKIAVFGFHALNRVGPDGKLLSDVVTELTQQKDVPVDPNDPNSPKFKFRGGTTLILSQKGEIRYAIHKNVDNEERLKRQRDYLISLETNSSLTTYSDSRRIDEEIRFDMVHRGY